MQLGDSLGPVGDVDCIVLKFGILRAVGVKEWTMHGASQHVRWATDEKLFIAIDISFLRGKS